MRSAAIVAFSVVLGLFVLLAALPYLSDEREMSAGAPAPPALTEITLVEVPAGSQVCVRKIVLDERMGLLRFRVGTYGRPGPPLAVSLTAPGYSERARVRAGWRDNAEHSVRVNSPPASRLGQVCLRNQGSRKIAIYGAADQARSRAIVELDGEAQDASPTLTFFERDRRTILSEPALTASRVAVFRGPLGYAWVVWAAAIVFLIALPVALVLALARAPWGSGRARAPADPGARD